MSTIEDVEKAGALLYDLAKKAKDLDLAIEALPGHIHSLRQPLWLDEQQTKMGRGLYAYVEVGDGHHPRRFDVDREDAARLLEVTLERYRAARQAIEQRMARIKQAIEQVKP